jgi:hypothetical protein
LNGTLNIPAPAPLPGEVDADDPMQFYFVADNGFGSTNNIVTPFCNRHGNFEGTKQQLIYNYRLSRGRQPSECSFGLSIFDLKEGDTQ